MTNPMAPEELPELPDWRELTRRLYVELFYCNQQMTTERRKWKAGPCVLNALADAKSALEAHPAPATQQAASNPTIPLSAIRPIAVEAIRNVMGCSDVIGKHGASLVEALEEVARAAAATFGEGSQQAATRVRGLVTMQNVAGARVLLDFDGRDTAQDFMREFLGAGPRELSGEATQQAAGDAERDAARFNLDFRPASEAPKVKRHGILGASDGYLLLNPCDGFHIMWAHFVDDGQFTGFRDFAGTEDHGPEFYVAWAELPNALLPQLQCFDRRRTAQADQDTAPKAEKGGV